MPDPTDDASLVRAAQADPARFALLYERYFGDVFRFLLRRAGQRELTADLTQQAFLKALLALPRYEPRGLPFRAWLYRIALNELRMHWRRRKELVIDLAPGHIKGMSEEMDQRIDTDDAQRLAQALSRLDEARAQLINLRFIDGLGYQEIGQVLGIGEDAAKMRTHRVLAALRANLAKRP